MAWLHTGSQSSREPRSVLVTSWQFSLLVGPQVSGQLAMAFLQALVGSGNLPV